ncbi:hypothetical protein [Sphingomonas glaciei]|uniref:Helix-turn-helix domain-containing protein n=1 Tax=Sphingomonas glaciei TaxID=2938948 RepID=A0ABY5MVZ2_9SPHN|nr:hypothetical protein [Sphingomonas glaciei]UUR07624.1 hypothetical protein M1K48_11885 [Sphingomonas glaciei]
MGIVGGNGCELQRRGERANEFGLERQQAFLALFAESCNISESARQVGVAVSTVYKRRRDDEQFRIAFATAQDHATALLKAELVRRGLELLRAATPAETDGAALAGMDAKFLLSLVAQHERSVGKELGDIKPQRSDAGEAAKRLQALLIRMRLERKREMEERRLERLERLERKR